MKYNTDEKNAVPETGIMFEFTILLEDEVTLSRVAAWQNIYSSSKERGNQFYLTLVAGIQVTQLCSGIV